MAISAVSSLSLSATQRSSLTQSLRDETAKVGKASNGRSKAEEEKAIAASSAAAGVGPTSARQVLQARQEKVEQNGPTGAVGGIPKPGQTRTIEQATRTIADNSVREGSSKVQAKRDDQTAFLQQRAQALKESKDEQSREDFRQQRVEQQAQQLRSPANVIAVQRAKEAEELRAAKQQNVEVRKVEQVDPRRVAAQVQSQQVQRNQEAAQAAKFKDIADVQLKATVAKTDSLRKEAIQGPPEATKARPQAEARSPVGQNINIKA